MAANLETIQQELAQLQEQYRAQVATLIRSLMDEHGLTADDLAPPAKRTYTKKATKPAAKTKAAKPAKKAAATKKAAPKKAAAKKKASPLKGRKLTLVPKYLNPETGETWTGHARPPAWIRDAEDREAFRIQQAA